MLRRLRRVMLPVSLSRGLEIVQAMTNKDTDTDRWYAAAVKHFILHHGDVLARDVTPDMIRLWSNSLDAELAATGNPYSEWTKNSYRRAIRAYFNKLVEVGHLPPPGPAAGFRVPSPPKSLPKHLSDDEVQRLRQYARQSARDHAMIEMLVATGCRLSDLLTMRVSSLHIEAAPSDANLTDDERELVSLAQSAGLGHLLRPEATTRLRGKIHVTGKGSDRKKKNRWVFFGDTAARALKDYLITRPHAAPDALWLTFDGRPMAKPTIYHAFKQVARGAGVDASPHDMRHTFAFRLIRNGADPKIVQELLGHSDLSTTMNVYYNLSDDELWQAYEEYG